MHTSLGLVSLLGVRLVRSGLGEGGRGRQGRACLIRQFYIAARFAHDELGAEEVVHT